MSHKEHSSHSKGATHQSDWYIDPVCGSDCRSGRSEKKALKTYAEWQRRVGRKSVLNPEGGTLTIHILNDLEESDPVTFDNVIAQDAFVTIVGEKKVVAKGTLGGVVDKDRTVNQPNVLTVVEAPNYWADKVGLFVFFPTRDNSNAIVARDLDAAQAHVGSWSGNVGFDGITEPAPPPVAGDPYEVVDFTRVIYSAATVNNETWPAGIIFKNLRIARATGDLGFGPCNFPVNIGNAEVFGAFSQCIIETPVFASLSHNNVLGNSSLLATTTILGGATVFSSQSVWNAVVLENGEYPGGVRVEGKWTAGDDPTFVGDGEGLFADVQILGSATFGPISFWGCNHGFVAFFGGSLSLENFDPLFGESGHVPLWGTGNVDAISISANSSVLINQIGFGGTTPPGPTIQYLAGVDWHFDPTIQSRLSHSFDPVAAAFTPLTDNLWANLDVPIPLGFQVGIEVDGPVTFYYSVSTTPQNNGTFAKSVFVIA